MIDERPIKKETRTRNLIYRDKTIAKICNYIYEETGCEKCRSRQFCSRDGMYWGCVSYARIADHLNAEGHKTSRGNEWQNKTVRDQIQGLVKKVSPAQKKERLRERNEEREAEVVWDTIERTDEVELMIEELEELTVVSLVATVGSDLDSCLRSLKRVIDSCHEKDKDVSILVVPSLE